MKWSKREEILLVSHFRDKTLSIYRRVRNAEEALDALVVRTDKSIRTGRPGKFPLRTLEAIRSKARRMGLIKKEKCRVSKRRMKDAIKSGETYVSGLEGQCGCE